jgi:hypothetical protein
MLHPALSQLMAAAAGAPLSGAGTYTQLLHALTALDVAVLPLPPELCGLVAAYARGVWHEHCDRLINDVLSVFASRKAQVCVW